MVTATGVLEIVGAVGLLVAPLAPYAAIGLTLPNSNSQLVNVRQRRSHFVLSFKSSF